MISKPVVLGLLAASCMTAAAGGAYIAVRQNDAARAMPLAPSERALTPSENPAVPPAPAAQPVAETEAVIAPRVPVEAESSASKPAKPATAMRTESPRTEKPRRTAAVAKETPRVARTSGSVANTEAARPAAQATSDQPFGVERPAPSREPAPSPPSAVAPIPAQPEPVPAEPPPPPRPQFVELVIPASSVVGLQVETSITSETAKVEDRLEARVTRDVMVDGRVAIPAGTRVIGDVTLVERGGKIKEKARLGVRFHTLVLADGNQVPFRTDSIFREGSSPGAESARKIGGAAIGGAIIGAIVGGAKGAAIGGATGAAGGSAVVMAGDRNAATLPAGTVVTVRLASPVSVDVEKEM
jgi:hypothetical protein